MHKIQKIESRNDYTGYFSCVNGLRAGFYTDARNYIYYVMEANQVSELIFSDKEIPDGFVLCLSLLDSRLVDCGIYGFRDLSSGKLLYFCKDKLISIFGSIPEKIWWNPVR